MIDQLPLVDDPSVSETAPNHTVDSDAMPRGCVAEEIPAVWQVYFAVNDVPGTVDDALTLGGKVFVKPYETATSVVAGILDPNGARFFVVSRR